MTHGFDLIFIFVIVSSKSESPPKYEFERNRMNETKRNETKLIYIYCERCDQAIRPPVTYLLFIFHVPAAIKFYRFLVIDGGINSNELLPRSSASTVTKCRCVGKAHTITISLNSCTEHGHTHPPHRLRCTMYVCSDERKKRTRIHSVAHAYPQTHTRANARWTTLTNWPGCSILLLKSFQFRGQLNS